MIAWERLYGTLGYRGPGSMQFEIRNNGHLTLRHCYCGRTCCDREQRTAKNNPLHCAGIYDAILLLRTSATLDVETNQVQETYWMLHTIQLAPLLFKRKELRDIWNFCVPVICSPKARKKDIVCSNYPCSIVMHIHVLIYLFQ